MTQESSLDGDVATDAVDARFRRGDGTQVQFRKSSSERVGRLGGDLWQLLPSRRFAGGWFGRRFRRRASEAFEHFWVVLGWSCTVVLDINQCWV